MTTDDAIAQVMRQWDEAHRLGRGLIDGLAVVLRNTPLFLRGDLVGVWFSNGAGERWPVYGRSSRGYAVRYHFMQGFRTRSRLEWSERWGKRAITHDQYNNKAQMAIVELPGEVLSHDEHGNWGLDPTRLRGWLLEALRAGCVASGVGSGSPALLLPLKPCPPRRHRRKKSPGRWDWRASLQRWKQPD